MHNSPNSQVVNRGVILEDSNPDDYVLGGISGAADMPIIFPDGFGWLKNQRPEETQKNRYFDSYSCVTFASLKSLSYYFKVVYGLDMDFSERFTAVMSGTIPGQGNSVRNVLESIRKDGFVLESDYPSMTPDMTQAEWFADPPAAIKKKALDNLKKWEIKWEVLSIANPFTGEVDHGQIMEGQKKGVPICIGYAWISDSGIYYDHGYPANHCFTIPEPIIGDSRADLMADDSYPEDFGIDPEPDANYLKKLGKTYSVKSAHIIMVKPVGEPVSLINKFKNMIKSLFTYWDSKGLHAFLVKFDKNNKPVSRDEIDINDPATAIRQLYVALELSGLTKKSSWPEIKNIAPVK